MTSTENAVIDQAFEMEKAVDAIVEKRTEGVTLTSHDWRTLELAKIDEDEFESRVKQAKKLQQWQQYAGTTESRAQAQQDLETAQAKLKKDSPKLEAEIETRRQKINELQAEVDRLQKQIEDSEKFVNMLTDMRPGRCCLPQSVQAEYRSRSKEVYRSEEFLEYIKTPARINLLKQVLGTDYGTGFGEAARIAGAAAPKNHPVYPKLVHVSHGNHQDFVGRDEWNKFQAECTQELEKLTEWLEHTKPDIEQRIAEVEDLKNYYVR